MSTTQNDGIPAASFCETTRSVCPQCLCILDALVLRVDGRIVMRKECPDHGPFEALISSDAEMYLKSLPYNKPGKSPLGYSTSVREGCPSDCGLHPFAGKHTGDIL